MIDLSLRMHYEYYPHMPEAKDTSSSAGDSLRPERCGECGYMLEGLPAEGQCPECGWQYDRDMIVMYGPMGDSGTNWTAKRQSAGRSMTGLLKWMLILFLLSCLVQLPRSMPMSFKMSWLLLTPHFRVVLVIVIAIAIRIWRLQQRRSRDPEEILGEFWQVQLSSTGFAQRLSPGPVSFRPWTKNLDVRLRINPWAPEMYTPIQQTTYRRWITLYIGRRGLIGTSAMLVSIGFWCEPAAVTVLCRRLEQWCAAVGASCTIRDQVCTSHKA